MIRIKLQEQTLGRQLKFCDKGLKRSRHGSLHANLPIGLAVETSQPHLNKTANLMKISDQSEKSSKYFRRYCLFQKMLYFCNPK